MKAFAITAAALLGSTACTHSTEAPASGREVRQISYETSPCFGTCPVYRFTVHRDGEGRFEGRSSTAVTGQRAFRATPQQFRAFARHLERVRPDAGSLRIEGANCPEVEATDHPAVEVKWEQADGQVQQLYYDYGCAPVRLRELAERLGTAPFLLPIGELIGPR